MMNDSNAPLPQPHAQHKPNVPSLHPGIEATLEKSSQGWQMSNMNASHTLRVFSRRVLGYFELPDKLLCGLAAVRLEERDRVWQFLNTKFGLIVRFEPGGFNLLGRCYLFNLFGGNTEATPRMSTLSLSDLDRSEGGLQSYDLRLSVSELFTLAYVATDAEVPFDSPLGASVYSANDVTNLSEALHSTRMSPEISQSYYSYDGPRPEEENLIDMDEWWS